MKLSNRLENALSSDITKMKVALGMNISYSTMIRYLTKTPEKFLSDIGTTALIVETGIPESELFEFEIQLHFSHIGEKDHETITVLAGSIQEAVNVGCAMFDTRSTIPKYAMYNNEKYTKTK